MTFDFQGFCRGETVVYHGMGFLFRMSAHGWFMLRIWRVSDGTDGTDGS